jgi:hypothetical protein
LDAAVFRAPLTLATFLPPPKKNTEKLGARYRRAMALEAAFFAAQPGLAPPRRRVSLLVVDFDDTCTPADTCATIARCAIARVAARAGAAGGGAAAEAAERARLEARLAELVAAYAARRDALLREILPPALDVSLNLPCAATFLPAQFQSITFIFARQPPYTTQPQPADPPPEFDFSWLGEFLDRLSNFDRDANSVLVDSGILRGARCGDLAAAGAALALRSGCAAALRRAAAAGVPAAVVSVNWSTELVVSALRAAGVPAVAAPGGAGGGFVGVTQAGAAAPPPPPGAVVVYANELEYYGEESTGGLRRRCECAADKGRVLDELLLALAADGGGTYGDVGGGEGGGGRALGGGGYAPDGSLGGAGAGGASGGKGEGESEGEGEGEVFGEPADLGARLAAPRDAPERAGSFRGGGACVYVGDSMTDLSPLAAADAGVVLGANALLRAVAAAAGLRLAPLAACGALEGRPAPGGAAAPVLYEADGWPAVEEFLFGRGFEAPRAGVDASYCADADAGRAPPRVLSIAGSDSGGGAGIQADLKTCMALGAFCATAVTALTAQNTRGVLAVHAPPPGFVRAQIDAVLDDLGADAAKTGMLPTAAAVAEGAFGCLGF